jgi:hypothetical protein
MACISASAAHSIASSRKSSESPAETILRLQRENDSLSEEVLQLRAAVSIYSELASRLSARQRFAGRDFHGTL